MSAGHKRHRHQDGLPEKLLAYVTPTFRARVRDLIKKAKFVPGFDNPYLVGRSTNFARIYPDRDLPKTIKIAGKSINTWATTAVHEATEWLLMTEDGLEYEDAHRVANHEERRYVEREYGPIWKEYCGAMDDYIKAAEHEKVRRVPRDLDLRMFEDEDDRAHLRELKKGMKDDGSRTAQSDR